MYHLLIEAGGLQQLSRIQPDWARDFVDGFSLLAGEHGFDAVVNEDDWLLFAWGAPKVPSPDVIVRCLEDVSEKIKSYSDLLLGYAVVVDFFDIGQMGAASRLARLVAYLRRIDSENSIWIAPAARSALQDLMDDEADGDVYRVNRFASSPAPTASDYLTSVRDERFQARIKSEVDRKRGGGFEQPILAVGNDVQQLVCNVVEACGTTPGESVPVIEWRDVLYHDAEASLHLALLRSISANLQAIRTEAAGEYTPLQDYADRFAASSHPYLSPSWRSGELHVAANMAIQKLIEEPYPVVAIVDSQSMPAQARDALQELLPADSIVTVIDCQKDPAIGHADHAVALDQERVAGGVESKSASARYWSLLADERADVNVAAVSGAPVTESSALARLLATFDQEYTIALWIWHRSFGVLANGHVDVIFPACGITLAERSRFREELRRAGLISPQSGLSFALALTSEILSEAIPESFAEINDRYSSAVLKLVETGQCHLTPELWILIQENLPRTTRFALWHQLVHSLAAGGALDIIDDLATEEINQDRILVASVTSAAVRGGLRDSRGPAEFASVVSPLAAFAEDESLPQQLRVDALLTYGEYDLAIRSYESALKQAKKAMYLSQSGEPGAAGSSHLLMARIMLARRRVADAGSYLNYSRELSEENDSVTYYMSTVLELIRQFLYGNLSGAERGSELLIPSLRSVGFTEWLVLVRFLRGRVSFELGDYEGARIRFADLAQFCVDCGMHGPGAVAAAWQIRSSGFRGRSLDELSSAFAMLGRRGEALLFSAEATIRAGGFAAALPILDEADLVDRGKEWWPRLGVCWDDGFAAVEDSLLAVEPGDSMLQRLIRAYRAWALAHCDRSDEAVSIFHSLTRETQGLLHDPYSGFYNYLYSTVLPKVGRRDRDDRVTVLGKAVKFVQERNSRIEDYRDKVQFLRANDWNRSLMSAAREHNLV